MTNLFLSLVSAILSAGTTAILGFPGASGGGAVQPFPGVRPELVAGTLSVRPASSDLGSDVRSVGEDGWVGYAVPRVDGHHQYCEGVVTLDSGRSRGRREAGTSDDGMLFVLYRVTSGAVTKVRTLGAGCRIDASGSAGERLHWLDGVSADGSLELLAGIARGRDEDVGEEAAAAIAFHADASADDLLGELAASAPSHGVRERALFWLGSARAEAGFAWLVRRAAVETDGDLKETIVFALHLSDAPGATEKLVELARRDPDSEVRERALFWLSQEAGAIASRAIASAARTDPDVEVKKKAVFALSQLPPDEGVPLLVEIAETHPSPEVRKKAFFWLGQSGDPRAAALFERILLGKP